MNLSQSVIFGMNAKKNGRNKEKNWQIADVYRQSLKCVRKNEIIGTFCALNKGEVLFQNNTVLEYK